MPDAVASPCWLRDTAVFCCRQGKKDSASRSVEGQGWPETSAHGRARSVSVMPSPYSLKASNKKPGSKAGFCLSVGSYYQPVFSATALPMSARLRTVLTPAASSAANFSSAVPLPPAMMAPAWPIRLPGGAVTPAM